MEALKGRGFEGVILAYAREVVVQHDEEANRAAEEVVKNEGEVDADVEIWKRGTLDTVEMAETGDFVALKYASPHVGRVHW